MIFHQYECRTSTSIRNYKYIKRLTRRKLSLKDICRQAIRKHMLNVNSTVNLFVRIPALELPSTLIEYLLYSVSLDSPTVIESGDHSDDDSDDHSDSDSYSSGGSTGSPSLFSVDEESDYSLTSENSTEESDDRSETTENTDSNDDDDHRCSCSWSFWLW